MALANNFKIYVCQFELCLTTLKLYIPFQIHCLGQTHEKFVLNASESSYGSDKNVCIRSSAKAIFLAYIKYRNTQNKIGPLSPLDSWSLALKGDFAHNATSNKISHCWPIYPSLLAFYETSSWLDSMLCFFNLIRTLRRTFNKTLKWALMYVVVLNIVKQRGKCM